MKLELNIEDGSKDDILAGMTRTWGKIMEDIETQGTIYDVNGNKIGSWILVDWDSKSSIYRYAQAKGIDIRLDHIREALDGCGGWTIGNAPVQEFFAAMLAV